MGAGAEPPLSSYSKRPRIMLIEEVSVCLHRGLTLIHVPVQIVEETQEVEAELYKCFPLVVLQFSKDLCGIEHVLLLGHTACVGFALVLGDSTCVRAHTTPRLTGKSCTREGERSTGEGGTATARRRGQPGTRVRISQARQTRGIGFSRVQITTV